MNNLIESIESLCNESEQNATTILAKIKAAIQNSKKPDFSKIKDGEHFIYRGIEFIRLGLEQGGVLCITAKAIGEFKFDEDNCKLYVSYSLPVSSYQFSIRFDSLNEDCAADFNVIFSKDGTVIKRVEVRGNTEIVYTVNDEVIGFNLVTIEMLSTSRPNHRIRVEAINNGSVTDFYLDFKLALAKPTVTRTKELKSVDVKVHSFTPRGYTESIFDSGMVEVHGETVIQANYNPAIDISAEITGGTLVSAEYYARTAFVRVSGDGVVNVVLTGRMLDETQSTVSVKENNTGDICPMDNPLITDTAVAQDVGEWVGRYLRNRNSYETNFRQDFRLDANDMIYFQSDFEERIPVRVTRIQYNLPGQTGAISARRLG